MTVFVIGQCTLHWGRMEFGNIGNYYIAEPMFRELHRVFPGATIKTTFQMSQDFCDREHVECVAMGEYYGWKNDDLTIARQEYAAAKAYAETGELRIHTPFIDDCLSSDVVVDFSGDIWGKNADLVGPNRFEVGLLKDRTAQLLGKPTAMIAGSPGPFNRDDNLDLAHEVLNGFKYVSNREPVSRSVLLNYGFDVGKVVDRTCPAFMFEPVSVESIKPLLAGTRLLEKARPTIGFILCGWNMLKGPFNRTDWHDDEFSAYVEALRTFVKKYDVNVCLMSHSNGFEIPPKPFKMLRGRDYVIVEQLFNILKNTDIADHVELLDGVYSAKETKAIISKFDMLVSGRVHGAVAGLSQSIPTVIIDYGHEPKAHKLKGFASVANVSKYVAVPGVENDLFEKMESVWNNRDSISLMLAERNIWIRNECRRQFDELRCALLENGERPLASASHKDLNRIVVGAEEGCVRHCSPQELPAEFIRSMITRIHHEYFETKPYDYDPVEWSKKLSSNAEALLIPDGCLFGYCNDFSGRCGFISYIGHLKSCPKGSGRRLHNAFVELSRSRGMRGIRLEVLKDNFHAREFYDRIGYVVIEDHGDKLLMELTLD